jgi:hypothetical protein
LRVAYCLRQQLEHVASKITKKDQLDKRGDQDEKGKERNEFLLLKG